jgi:sugar phosphate permease
MKLTYKEQEYIGYNGGSLKYQAMIFYNSQNLISGVQSSRVTAKEAISGAFGMISFFGYVGTTFSGTGLTYIT